MVNDLLTYGLASVYHSVGFLALLVALSFTGDAWRRHREAGKGLGQILACYFHSWLDWLRNIPNDVRIIFGRVEALPDTQHPYGAGYPLQVGIAHTAWAWAGMAFYWSERNQGWAAQMDIVGSILPFVWSWLYGRGYLMHLKTIWRDKPYCWRQLLLGILIYIPTATILRTMA